MRNLFFNTFIRLAFAYARMAAMCEVIYRRARFEAEASVGDLLALCGYGRCSDCKRAFKRERYTWSDLNLCRECWKKVLTRHTTKGTV